MKATVRLFLVFAILLLVSPSLYSQQSSHTLSHHVRTAVSSGQAAPVGKLSPAKRLHLSFVLPLRDQAGLTRLLSRIYDPSSPDYHHFLNVTQFTEQFAPSADDYQKVVDFARSSGFTVTDLAPNHLVVSVSGTVQQIEKAFNVRMRTYRHPTEDREFFSPDREPSLPLNVNVTHIAGLNDFSIPRPLLKKADAARPLDSSAMSGSGPYGLFLGSDLRAAYYGGSELTGKGQIVGLLEFDGFNQSDVDLTFSSSGQFYSVPIEKVPVADSTGAACQFSYPCDDAEQVVDIVQAIGMAPGLSQVRVYIGYSDTDLLNAIATENLAKEVSISWAWSPDDPTTDDPFFEECAAQGQSIFVASGDYGTYAAGAYPYPAEDAYVTAVGGTDLVTATPAGPWSSETVWSQSGGGISPDAIAIPSWQTGVANASNGASTTLRNVPDVAMEANTDNYYCAQGSCAGAVGGTSLAAPRWAAFIALANEQGQNAGDSLVGFLNPALYKLAEGSNGATDLHDMIGGNNDYSGTCNGQPYCQAVPGYDLVTGWGSAAGQPLIDALAPPPAKKGFELSSSANTLTITPGSSASTTITVVAQGGFTGNVSFAVSGLPAGISATWSANPATTTSQLTFTVGANVLRGSYGVTVTGTSGTQTATTVMTLGVNAPGFVIYPAPGDLEISQGDTLATTIQVEYLNGFSGNVALAITSPLPSGVTASWTQDPTTGLSMLTFNVGASTPLGANMVTITGTSGGLSATTAVSLRVFEPIEWITVSPGFVTVAQGQSGTVTLTPAPQGTVTGPITLSSYDLPTGVSISFNPASVSPGQTSQITFTTDMTTPLGLNGITIMGNSQSNSYYGSQSGFGITVTATPQPSVSVGVSPGYAQLMQGGTATLNISVNEQNGFNGSTYLAIGTPPGVTASFSQNPTANSSVLMLTANATAQPGTWILYLAYGNSPANYQGTTPFFLRVQPSPGFSLASSAPSIALTPGGSGTASVTVVPQTGFTGNVQLSVISNLPQGVSASFGQNPTTGSSLLSISTSDAVANGAYLIEIAGTSGGQITTTYLTLNVETATTTNLTITPVSEAQNAPPSYILAATVLTASGQPVRGQVNFCDAESAYCTDVHLLGTTQLTSTGMALLRVHPAAGAHNYKAVFPGTPNSATPYAASSSSAASLVAKGSSTTTLSASGSPGDYTLTATVAGVGTATPGGTVSFADSTQGGATLASASLGSGTQNLSFTTLSNAVQAATPSAMVSGDFNGDGIPDLAVANSGAGTVTIFIGDGDGSFAPMANPVPVGGAYLSSYAIAVADFNGDGNLDLAVVDVFANSVTILLGHGDGTFTAGASVAGIGSQPDSLIAGDFNGDGIPDLAVANLGPITILLGNGDGTFTATSSSLTGGYPIAITTGDFNGDGILDLATANGGTNTVAILLGNGDGTFGAAQSYPAGNQPGGIVAADFNRDGKLDLAVTNFDDSTVMIFQGNGDGTFIPQPVISTSLNQPQTLAVADFNADGNPDLAVANVGNDTITIFLGNGDGTFQSSSTPYNSTGGDLSLVSADFNQDGIPDLAIANWLNSALKIQLAQLSTTATAIASGVAVTGSGTHTVVANFPGDNNYTAGVSPGVSLSSEPPVPAISTISPAYVSAGATTFALTANGSGFVSGSTVHWGTTVLTTTYVSATQLTATVPASDISSAGVTAITVQTTGGGISNSTQFEVDSPQASSYAPSYSVASATIAAGSTANYAVTLPSSASNVTLKCLNLPAGATCSYSASAGTVSIATGATTPKGTYQVTTVFTETVSAQSAALVILPSLLIIPLYRARKRLRRKAIWTLACLTLLVGGMVFTLASCGGSGGNSGVGGSSTPPTQQVTSSGVVTLTIQ